MKKFTVLGTSHISPDSVEKVKDTILKTKPDCVAIELCPKRYYALTHPTRPTSPMFMVLSYIQKELGKTTGIFPGSEMLQAIKSAHSIGAKVVFIDKSIDQIGYELSSLPLIEKIRLVTDSLLGFAQAKITKVDFSSIPEDKMINQAIQEIKKHYPRIYKILIRDRNTHMINTLRNLECKKIIVVVGAGHKKAIERGLKCLPSAHKKSKI
jgi:pheromone shutdown protein TraB